MALANMIKEIDPPVELTQAQYDALTTAQKNDGTVYFITDGNGSFQTAATTPAEDTSGGDSNVQAELEKKVQWDDVVDTFTTTSSGIAVADAHALKTLNDTKANSNEPNLKFRIGASDGPTSYPHVELRSTGTSGSTKGLSLVYYEDANTYTSTNLVDKNGTVLPNFPPKNHAFNGTTYGIGTGSVFGHVKLNNSYTSSGGAAADGVAASSKAVCDAYTKTQTHSILNVTLNSNFQLYNSSSVFRIIKVGRLCQIYGTITPKTNLASGQQTIGTISNLTYAPQAGVTTVCQGSGSDHFMLLITASGSIKVNRYQGGAWNAGTWMNIHATYISNE